MRPTEPLSFPSVTATHLLPSGPGMAGVWVWPFERLVSSMPTRLTSE